MTVGICTDQHQQVCRSAEDSELFWFHLGQLAMSAVTLNRRRQCKLLSKDSSSVMVLPAYFMVVFF